mgnify:CR=1 FL=1
MKKFLSKIIFLFVFSLVIVSPSFSSEAGTKSYTEGCIAFSRGEWESAVFLLRKAVAYPENDTADANYMLITAEIYAGDNSSALSDCDDFLLKFPKSMYAPRMQYTKGKLLYSLGEYDKSIMVLSDFCHKNENSDLYPSALFYIAESLFAGYKYEEAESLYIDIVTKYPESEKVAAAQYRIEIIAQRSREEKLLYLLKQTGEEYLAAKEDYEKQLKFSSSDAVTREKLLDSQQKNKELEEQIQDLEKQIADLKAEQAKTNEEMARREAESEKYKEEQALAELLRQQEKDEEVKKLKQKALIIEQIYYGK